MVHPVKTLRRLKWYILLIASGCETSPRSSRGSAENVPRTLQKPAEIPPYACREPSKHQPRTTRMNPMQSCLSHCDFFERPSFSDKRFHEIA